MARDISILKKKLTNLSSANPLLWQSRLRAGIHIDLSTLLFETVVSSSDFLNQLCSGKKRIRLAEVFNPRNPAENRMGASLHRLARLRLTENQERGTDQLFLAWPFISGRWPDGTALRTPFQLIPLNLFSDGAVWWAEPKVSEALINPAFMLAYVRQCGKPLDEDLFEKELDLDASDAHSYLTRLYERLESSSLDIHFNSALFSLELEPLRPLKKEEMNAASQPGMLRLQPHAVMGLFPLSDSLLLPDFDEMERKGMTLEKLFLEDSGSALEISEKELLFPLPADGSQEACLKEILSGKNLLVEGPPGSGKSQMITNLAAAAAGSGKSVLIVCQKKVALEVVLQRLNDLGIGKHVAMWADFRHDVSALYAAIASQIDELEETQQRNKGLDTVMLEREYNRVCQEISRISASMEEWKTANFDESLAGISWFELKKNSYSIPSYWNLRPAPVFREFRGEEWADFRNWFNQNIHTLQISFPDGNLLRYRGRWPSLELPGEFKKLKKIVRSEEEYILYCSGFTQVDSSAMKSAGAAAAAFSEVAEEFKGESAEVILAYDFSNKLGRKAEKIKQLYEYLKPWPQNPSLTEEEFVKVLAVYRKNEGIDPAKLFIGSVFSQELNLLRKWFTALKESGFDEPGAALLSASELMKSGEDDLYFGGISVFGGGLKDVLRRLSAVPDLLPQLAQQRDFLKKYLKLEPLKPAFTMEELRDKAKEMSFHYLQRKKVQKQMLALFPSLPAEESLNLLRTDFDQIQSLMDPVLRAEQLLDSIPKHWQEALQFFRENLISPESDQADYYWRKFWMHEMENFWQILRHSPDWHQKQISSLQKAILRKQELARDILRLNLEESSHKNLVMNRLQNRVSYRNLYHQVTKKRQRMPLRTLWNSFADEILRLIPCWLATPESVSATWPLDMKFDLVIFDEASQCFAEKGLPSVARGRRIVVLGDAKQLPPNNLFSSRWEEDASDPEETFFSEQDSLLDLARQFYPSRMLTGHYRSQYPELIDFSNRLFYKGKLQVIPPPLTLRRRSPAIKFVKLDGSWENRSNRSEAEWIAENALQFFREEKERTLGIICFNISQQEKIEEEILNRSIRESLRIPEWFFVKNIENVQGDERDFIWFSLGYARNAAGNIQSWFGSLSQEGGENRLNVAITRARSGITIISSLSAQEWSFAERLSRGPALLAAYVEFASGIAARESVETSLAEGSLKDFCDEIIQPGREFHLIFKSLQRIYPIESMKAHFGLNPLYYQKLGYRVRFEYWT